MGPTVTGQWWACVFDMWARQWVPLVHVAADVTVRLALRHQHGDHATA
jgi:hypothetical protein